MIEKFKSIFVHGDTKRAAICLTKCFRFVTLVFPLDIIDITHGTSVSV